MWKKTLPYSEEQELLERAQAGNEQAYEQVILAYTPALYQLVRCMLEDDKQIELILQETFWKAWRSFDRCKTDQPILPYLTSIAKNLVLDRYRSKSWLIDKIE
jgi:DNA-directed RNA polymerase specialized sigma subunit, sigma24 homolog